MTQKKTMPRDTNQRGKAVVDVVTKWKPELRGMVLWNGDGPQDTIVLTPSEQEPIRIKGTKPKTSTGA